MGLCAVIAQNYHFSAKQNAKRLHGASVNGPHMMYSPLFRYRVSHTMPKNNTKKTKSGGAAKVASLRKELAKVKITKSKPFRETGGILGNAIGSMFGAGHIGRSAGRWLGSGIGSIFGSGDYTMVGATPAYNVMTNQTQIPKFSTTAQTNIVCHREYLGDIMGTAAFSNTAYPLNPGIATTFPWLSGVSGAYQEYRFHGIVFEFRPLITDFVTNGAPGVVIMATNYNADTPIYATKQQMENSEFAVSIKPTTALMHGVECATTQTILPQRYVRNGAVPLGQDLRLYDYGNFQFATQSNPVQALGELWVSYCVEFFKPVMPVDVTASPLTGHASRTNLSGTNPFGLIGILNSGDLALTVTPTSITFNAIPQQRYLVTMVWIGVSQNITIPTVSQNGLVPYNMFGNSSVSTVIAPVTGITTTTMTIIFAHTCNLVAPGPVVITCSTSGFYPSSAYYDVVVSQLDQTAL